MISEIPWLLWWFRQPKPPSPTDCHTHSFPPLSSSTVNLLISIPRTIITSHPAYLMRRKLTRYDRAAARRYFQLQTEAGESSSDIYMTIGLKLGVTDTTAYRMVVNKGHYDDQVSMDEKLLKQMRHVDWDLEVVRRDQDFTIGGLMFPRRIGVAFRRGDRAVIRRLFDQQQQPMSESSRRKLIHKLVKKCRVERSAVTEILENEQGDDLEEDQVYLDRYDEREKQIGKQVRLRDADRDASDGYDHGELGCESAGDVGDRTTRSRRRLSMDDVGSFRLMSSSSDSEGESVEIVGVGTSTGGRSRKRARSSSPACNPRVRSSLVGYTSISPSESPPERTQSLGRQNESAISSSALPSTSSFSFNPAPSSQLQSTSSSVNPPPNPDLSQCQPKTPMAAFLHAAKLPHLAFIFHAEGFSTAEDLTMLKLLPFEELKHVLDEIQKTYGQSFLLADKLAVFLALQERVRCR